jgi:hypothetical protein
MVHTHIQRVVTPFPRAGEEPKDMMLNEPGCLSKFLALREVYVVVFMGEGITTHRAMMGVCEVLEIFTLSTNLRKTSRRRQLRIDRQAPHQR